METVYVVEDCHIEWRGGAFFFVATHVQVGMVAATIGEPVDQPWRNRYRTKFALRQNWIFKARLSPSDMMLVLFKKRG